MLASHGRRWIVAARLVTSSGWLASTSSKPWHRALVLTAPLTGLRWGELIALRRRHLDLDGGFVDVRSAVVENGTDLTVDRTKSDAGVRFVGLPATAW
jgi:integrase